MNRTKFSESEIIVLRNSFASIETASVDSLPKFRAILDGCDNQALVQLATSNIKFVSKLAINECVRRCI
jgi:hypothetical protein